MKVTIDFSQPILDLRGNPVPDGGTLKQVCELALSNVLQGDDQVDAKIKYEWFDLAKRIVRAETPIDIKSEDITLLKTRISRMFNIVVSGSATDLLEKKETPVDE